MWASDDQETLNRAAAKIRDFKDTQRVSDEDELKLYGLKMQATVGDNTKKQPQLNEKTADLSGTLGTITKVCLRQKP